MKLFQQVLVLGLLAAAVAGGLRAWQPFPLGGPGPGQLTLEQARVLEHTRVVVWVDARNAAAFASGHVPGAVNLNLAAWETGFAAMLKQWTPDRAVVVYCDDASCQASEEVAARLRGSAGLPEVYVLYGGWEAAQKEMENGRWKEAK